MRPAPGRNEWPLVAFTVLAQAAAGIAVARAAAWALARDPRAETWLLPLSLALLVAAVAAAALHLGRPGRAWLALGNLRSSWLSREILLAGVFGAVLTAEWATGIGALAVGSAAAGLAFVHAIARVYRLRTVPAWDTAATPALFFGTALLLGAAAATATRPEPALAVLAAVLAGLQLLANRLQLGSLALGRLRPVFRWRIAATLAGAAILLDAARAPRPDAVAAAAAFLLVGEVLGRFLFYASHRRVGL